MDLIVESQYFASIIFYKISYNFSHIVFEQCESYQKMSFRNRCQIAGAQGVIDLGIPLVGGRGQKGLTRDVRIAGDRSWQAQHWKTIVSCYSRSPWFEFYRHELEELYRRRFDYLLDWNLSCFEWSLRMLGLSIPVSLTERFEKEYDDENVTDWRGKILPKNREGGPGEGVWSEDQAPKYRQVFEERIGFIPNLSVLDLLFCEGKEAIRYIRSS